MKVRGSLKVTKDLILENPGNTFPKEGMIALSDILGKVRWGHLIILPLDISFTYPDKGTLVSHEGKVYFSLAKNVAGTSIGNKLLWRQVGLDANRDNIVRNITVFSSDLDGQGTIKEQLCSYILSLPALERTIRISESKWNILYEDSAYEITGKGSGELIELEPEDLLSIGTDKIWNDVLTLKLEGDVTGEVSYENGELVIKTTVVAVPEAEVEDVTDYNYSITGDRKELNPLLLLTREYIPGTLKVFLNGMRLTRGNYYDYREGTSNILVMNFPLEEEELLIVDYKSIKNITDQL